MGRKKRTRERKSGRRADKGEKLELFGKRVSKKKTIGAVKRAFIEVNREIDKQIFEAKRRESERKRELRRKGICPYCEGRGSFNRPYCIVCAPRYRSIKTA